MACNTETKQIGEHECSVTQWPADKSMLMKFRLTKAFGASLATMVGDMDGDPEAEDFASGLSKLFETSSPEELVTLMKDCVINAAWDGTKITDTSFNQSFSGDDLLDVYKIFIFVLQVNYANLFKGQLANSFLAKLKASL